VNLDSPEKGFYKLGGRATRLFVVPLIRALSKRGLLKGLDKLRYPLSGEFAGSRTLFESIEFPSGYEAEMAILIQMWKRNLTERIAQVDLGLFQHFPQSDKAIHQMVKQIIQLMAVELRDHGGLHPNLVDDYLSEARNEIASSQAMYEKAEVRIKIEHEVKRDFFNDVDGDKNKAAAYAEELRNVMADPALSKRSVQRLPSWSSIGGTAEGARLLSFIRRRGTASTVELLSKQGLVSV
jgi:glucosyl-3-phosphoglycerate synthase